MLDLLFTNPMAFVVAFGGLVLAIGIHEAAHCYMTDYLGDPTPRSLGRVTLNPLAHLDPIGTLVILITGVFGWGKPSPFDPYNLQDPKRDTALIALAGPASNIVLAIVLSLLIRFLNMPELITSIAFFLVRLNLGLAVFNLIPVAPLDGSKIVGIFLSHEQAIRFQNMNNPLLLLALIFPLFGGASLASIIVSPIINTLLGVLL